MLKIGLTGGIGSGKTTVAQIFQVLNIPVLFADEIGKKLMVEDNELKQQIITAFGPDCFSGDTLNRSYLANIVFSNKEKLDLLNSFVHPKTIAYTKNWISKQKAPYIIKEAALLFESNAHEDTDYVIGIRTSLETRIERTMTRNNISLQEVQKRINNQMGEEEKLSRCDFIITNDDNDLLIPQVLHIHKELINKIS